MTPNIIYQVLTMDRSNSVNRSNADPLKEKLVNTPKLWLYKGRRLNSSNPVIFRLVIIMQYYLFLFRQGLFLYCAKQMQLRDFKTLEDILEQCIDSWEPINFKVILPCSYDLSVPCRFHKQLFQISKQYQNTAIVLYNSEIQTMLHILTSRITEYPLWVIPAVASWTYPIILAIMAQLKTNIWAGGQNRQQKINDLITTIMKQGYSHVAIAHTMCFIYHALNCYLNWTMYNMQQYVVNGRITEDKVLDLEPDLRCTLCLKNMVTRASELDRSVDKRKKKAKNTEIIYCVDDFKYLTNCCYAPARKVPLVRNGVKFLVYTANRTRYGICDCGIMHVQDPIENGNFLCQVCQIAEKPKVS